MYLQQCTAAFIVFRLCRDGITLYIIFSSCFFPVESHLAAACSLTPPCRSHSHGCRRGTGHGPLSLAVGRAVVNVFESQSQCACVSAVYTWDSKFWVCMSIILKKIPNCFQRGELGCPTPYLC